MNASQHNLQFNTKAIYLDKEVKLFAAGEDKVTIIPASDRAKCEVVPVAHLTLAFRSGRLEFPFETADTLPQAANQSACYHSVDAQAGT